MIKLNFKTFWDEKWEQADFSTHSRNVRFYISNYGRLASSVGDEAAELRKPIKVNNYLAINTRTDSTRTKLFYIHKLVAQYFLKKATEDQRFVIHLDHNKHNNYHKNLSWANYAERGANQKENPEFIKVKHNAKYKKLDTARREILIKKITDPKRKTRYKLIAKQFGISLSHLYRIKRDSL